jgi:PAS domain S-box-containing protein
METLKNRIDTALLFQKANDLIHKREQFPESEIGGTEFLPLFEAIELQQLTLEMEMKELRVLRNNLQAGYTLINGSNDYTVSGYIASINRSPEAILVFRNSKIICVNTAAKELFNAPSVEAFEDRNLLFFIHAEFHQSTIDRIDRIAADDFDIRLIEEKFLKFDGTALDVEVKYTPIVFDGSPAIQLFVRDISKRKQEEHQLKLLESVITNSNDAIVITEAEPLDDPGPKILYVNEAFTQMTGYSSEEIIGKTPRILQGIKSDRNELAKLKAALKNWEPCNITNINYKKNGEEFWVNLSINPVADKNGRYSHWIAIQRDITEQKNAALQREQLAQISQLFNEPYELNTILEHVLEALVTFGGFNLAEAWLIDTDPSVIHLVATSKLINNTRLFYEECAHINSFKKNEDLPGIAWQNETIQIWKNIQNENRFVRRVAAKKAGLNCFYTLPIIYNNEVIGVFLFGLNRDDESIEKYTGLLKNLGTNIGTEIKRKQLEQQLFQIFNYAPDIICVAGFDGYFKKINHAATKLFEFTMEELLAVPYIEFIHPDDSAQTSFEIKSFSRGLTNNYFENRVITKSGEVKWLAWTLTLSPGDGLLFGVAKDITEKKELENLLKKVNHLAHIGVWELDTNKDRLYWSDETKKIHEVQSDFELTPEKAIGFYKPGTSRERISAVMRKGLVFGNSWDEELQIVTAKGNERWIRSIGEAEFVKGKCNKIYGNIQDIDTRKKAEIAFKQNIKALTDYKFALDQSAIIAITDEKGIIQYANDNFCKISKYSTEELIGKTHRILNSKFHPKDFFKDLWCTISEGKVWKGEIKNRAKDGELYWVDATIIPFLDADKKPFQYLTIRFDITERKLAEGAIKDSNERYNLVAKATNDALWDWNLVNGDVLRTGEGLQSLFGYDRDAATGDNMFWQNRIHPDDINRIVKKRENVLGDPLANYWEDEYRFLKSNNQYAFVYDKGYIIRNDQGIAVRIIGATQDVSKLKENEIYLNEMNERLQKKARELSNSNMELEQFAFVASHDLQEPLRMVTSFLKLIEKKYYPVIDDTGKQYIEYAVEGAKQMRQIILDLIEYSRVGRTSEQMQALNLNELVNEIQLLFREQFAEKKAVIKMGILPIIMANIAPIRQVFQNLIGNALKYSRNNVPIEINIACREIENYWEISIADNGIGIAKEYFEKIFIIFKRLHNKEQFSGTGIGLAVTKKVIDKQGGKIWVESVVGKGSTFYFTIKK